MRKIILIYGLISGVIVASIMTITMASGVHGGTMGMILGYLSMLIAFSFVFVGVKKYRDNDLGGVIKFGHAFVVGIAIALIGALIYVLNWEVYMYFTNYTFMEEYTKSAIEAARAKGMPAAEIAAYQAQMSEMTEQYKNPIYRMLFTFSEIAPVGFVVSLIVAWNLRFPKVKS